MGPKTPMKISGKMYTSIKMFSHSPWPVSESIDFALVTFSILGTFSAMTYIITCYLLHLIALGGDIRERDLRDAGFEVYYGFPLGDFVFGRRPVVLL